MFSEMFGNQNNLGAGQGSFKGISNPTSFGNLGGNSNPASFGSLGGNSNPASFGNLGGNSNPATFGSLGGNSNPASFGNLGGNSNPASFGSFGGNSNPASFGSFGGNPNSGSFGSFGTSNPSNRNFNIPNQPQIDNNFAKEQNSVPKSEFFSQPNTNFIYTDNPSCPNRSNSHSGNPGYASFDSSTDGPKNHEYAHKTLKKVINAADRGSFHPLYLDYEDPSEPTRVIFIYSFDGQRFYNLKTDSPYKRYIKDFIDSIHIRNPIKYKMSKLVKDINSAKFYRGGKNDNFFQKNKNNNWGRNQNMNQGGFHGQNSFNQNNGMPNFNQKFRNKNNQGQNFF